MSVKISDVDVDSVCFVKGIRAGDMLQSINGNAIEDVLDFEFYGDEEKLRIEYVNGKGKTKHFCVKNITSAEDLGLKFETYLMDKHRSCKNHCIFCFIDQMPKNMRETLYFKDDDSRLSFLFGNYITLTNLTEHEIDRIIKMHISPLNVSVHTMNPELRVRMMRNPNAGNVLSLLNRFSDAGIALNTQLVLCPGINDGDELDFSLNELGRIASVNSIAAVPVGLTRFRENLYPLKGFSSAEAGNVIDRIDSFNKTLMDAGRNKIAYPSDEFFQLAGRKIPEAGYYGDYPQLDNGVGMCRLTEDTFSECLADSDGDEKERSFAVATGRAAYPLIKKLAEMFCGKFRNSTIDVYMIENEFFGENVTVAGLITGNDLIRQLKTSGFSGCKLLLPSVMFKSTGGRIFLDDLTAEDVQSSLNTEVVVTDCSSENLFEAFVEA